VTSTGPSAALPLKENAASFQSFVPIALPSGSQRHGELRQGFRPALRLLPMPAAVIAFRSGLPEQLKCKPNQHDKESRKVSDPAERPEALAPEAPMAVSVMAGHQTRLLIIGPRHWRW